MDSINIDWRSSITLGVRDSGVTLQTEESQQIESLLFNRSKLMMTESAKYFWSRELFNVGNINFPYNFKEMIFTFILWCVLGTMMNPLFQL